MKLLVKPKIKLIGEKEIIIEYEKSYKEKGVTATYFGFNINKQIKKQNNIDLTKIGEYEVIYEINNKLLPKSKQKRIIKVVDKIPPEMTLNGSDKITIYKGEQFNDPKAKSIDNYDGDISEKIEIISDLDTNKIKDYEIVYKSCDSSLNCSELKRTITVKEKTTSKGVGVPVLMYHFFYDKSKGEKPNDGNWIDVSLFEQEMKYLKDNNYYFPSWQEMLDFVNGKIELPKKSIVVTIDDGDASFFKHAVPIIEKHNIKATSFIITGWYAYRVKEYKTSNLGFETHTHNMHTGGCKTGHGGLMQCIDYNKGLQDMKTSIDIVGSSYAFAYPFGDVNDNVIKITNDAGIKLAFTTNYGKVYKGMNKLKLPRIRINGTDSLNSFINKIS